MAVSRLVDFKGSRYRSRGSSKAKKLINNLIKMSCFTQILTLKKSKRSVFAEKILI